MKILHSSDWHLGRSLYGRKRYEEQEAFLRWLVGQLEEHCVDVLLVSGDIFDSGTPGNRAQELYYSFLHKVSRSSSCRHVVVIAGNHDSPSFLSASRILLSALDIHVVGAAMEEAEDEVLVLRDSGGAPELVVCAVPYLRERDIRSVEVGESVVNKERNSQEGIRAHYAAVVAAAERVRCQENGLLPIVLMGHLFVTGGKTVEGDGVRDLYVGSLGHVSSDIFSSSANYVALGHLHIPQRVKGSTEIHYSGSPIPMGFGEVGQEKSVSLVTMANGCAKVELVPVPVFQRLERIKGDSDGIVRRIGELRDSGESIWLEVMHEGSEVVGNLREQLEEAVAGSLLEILRISSGSTVDMVLGRSGGEESLTDLNPVEVFERCLVARDVPEEQRPSLLQCYNEILHTLQVEGKL